MALIKRNIEIDTLEKVGQLLKSIAHPVRLEILLALEANEILSVNDLSKEIDIEVEQSLLSHHLIKMKDRGILKSHKEGKYVMYTISDRQILKIFDCMEKCEF